MALDVLGSIIPSTVGGIVSLLIQVLIIWICVVISDKLVAHQIEAKRALILAVLAYFIAPLLLIFVPIGIPFAGLLIPLVVWILLGELLLHGDFKGRLKIAAVAFIVYIILSFAGLSGIIAGLIPV